MNPTNPNNSPVVMNPLLDGTLGSLAGCEIVAGGTCNTGRLPICVWMFPIWICASASPAFACFSSAGNGAEIFATRAS